MASLDVSDALRKAVLSKGLSHPAVAGPLPPLPPPAEGPPEEESQEEVVQPCSSTSFPKAGSEKHPD